MFNVYEMQARATEVLVETRYGSFMVNDAGRIRQVEFKKLTSEVMSMTAQELADKIRARALGARRGLK